jgi:catechol 2,3-dioxygenase-like lactoylglutathione lyase family enzyme
VDDLHEVRLGHAVGEPYPAVARHAGRLDGQHLHDRDPALAQEEGLVAADQAPSEDDRDVRLNLSVRERLSSRVHVVARVLEERDELGLPRREDENALTSRPHRGILPTFRAFKACDMGTDGGMKVETLDHVALWVADRDAIADFVTRHLGMHVIERTDNFTLVGADARRGKLTLFAAEGDREPGVLARIGLRVFDLNEALAELPPSLPVERQDGVAAFDAPGGVPLGLVQVEEGAAYDLDHVAFRVNDPERSFLELADLGFSAKDGRLEAGGAYLTLEAGTPRETERPLLNHLGLRVESADAHITEAERRGLEIADVVDAANTYAVFVWGPDRIKLEYVEHKPTFSLT